MRITKRLIKKTPGFVYSKIKKIQISRIPISSDLIFVIGHQKTGTSVIAGLLGEATKKSSTIDFFHKNDKRYPDFRRELFVGDLSLQDLININKEFFLRDIVKEPDLTFHYEKLVDIFPGSKFIFVTRDPRTTIRSILNRLQISGKIYDLSKREIEELDIPLGWKSILKGEFPNVNGSTFIERLAHRWNLASDVYLKSPENMLLVKYEDFTSDKIGTISNLASRLNLIATEDISHKVDFQYQPMGNQTISLADFFAKEHLNAIENICKPRMDHFDYQH